MQEEATNIVQLRQSESEAKPQDLDDVTKFRGWWSRIDRLTQDAIREIVNEGERSKKNDAVEVLNFLNMKTGKNYRPVPVTLDAIRARLDSGVTVEDMKSVIAMMCRKWGNDEKMAPYLRPATLFNRTKFEQYLGELA